MRYMAPQHHQIGDDVGTDGAGEVRRYTSKNRRTTQERLQIVGTMAGRQRARSAAQPFARSQDSAVPSAGNGGTVTPRLGAMTTQERLHVRSSVRPRVFRTPQSYAQTIGIGHLAAPPLSTVIRPMWARVSTAPRSHGTRPNSGVSRKGGRSAAPLCSSASVRHLTDGSPSGRVERCDYCKATATPWKASSTCLSTATRLRRSDVVIARWREKPKVIEAVQWDGTNTSEIIDWGIRGEHWGSARWHEAVYADGAIEPLGEHIAIDTPKGTMWAALGDWVIRGVAGEFYPCKPDIFAATYEPADGDPPTAEETL